MKTDLELVELVEEELEDEPKANVTEIGVTAKDGVVTLMGSVDSLPAKWEAEQAAMRVSGVQAVANEIEVVLPGVYQRSDADIARAAADALAWNGLLPHEDDVQVAVEDGWVTLSGQLEREFQKRTAENLMHQLVGVKGVTNEILVPPQTSSMVVKEKITAVLKQNAALDAEEIHVEANDGQVTLQGVVRSWAVREDAEAAAWSVPGVDWVTDKLVIGG